MNIQIVHRSQVKSSIKAWWRVDGREYHIKRAAPQWQRVLFIVYNGWRRPLVRFMYQEPGIPVSDLGA